MSEQLTQEEIDALRTAVKTGSVEEMAEAPPRQPADDLKIVSYDFRKPKLLSAERMQTLQLMHQTLAKQLQSLLFSMFKVSGQPALEALEQVTYGEYVLSVAPPSCLLGAAVEPNIGPIALELSPPMGQMLLDLLLGGDGKAATEDPAREMTEFEFEIMRAFNDHIIEELKSVWQPHGDLEFNINAQGVSPDQVQVAAPDTPCLIAAILLRIEEQETRLQICYPFSVLQEIFSRADSAGEDQSGKQAETRKKMLTALHPAPLSIEVELGKAQISARDLSTLSVGDIIKLDHAVGTPFPVAAGSQPVGQAFIGSHRGRAAACIERLHAVKKAGDPSAPPNQKKPNPAKGKPS